MTTRSFGIRIPAGPDTTFAPSTDLTGQEMPVRVGDASVPGKVIASEVIENGAAISMTIEVDGDSVPLDFIWPTASLSSSTH